VCGGGSVGVGLCIFLGGEEEGGCCGSESWGARDATGWWKLLSTNQPTNQLTNKPISQSTNQPTNHPTTHPTIQPTQFNAPLRSAQLTSCDIAPPVGVVAIEEGAEEAAPQPPPSLVEEGSPAPVLAPLSTECLLASDMRLCVVVGGGWWVGCKQA
jgi:hypothetical protein